MSISVKDATSTVVLAAESGKVRFTDENNVLVGMKIAGGVGLDEAVSKGQMDLKANIANPEFTGIMTLEIPQYTTSTDINLRGKGISLKNDMNGSDNNWTIIKNHEIGDKSGLTIELGNANIIIGSYGEIRGTPSTIKASGSFISSSGAIKDSDNIASVVRNGPGNYTVTLSTGMANTNFRVIMSTDRGGVNGGHMSYVINAVNSFSLYTFDATSTGTVDHTEVSFLIVGDL